MNYPYPGYIPGVPYQQSYPARQPAPQATSFICRPGAGEEEARAIPTDFSGATIIMPDLGHGKIYTKALNYADGSPIFQVFEAPKMEAAPPVVFALKSDLTALAQAVEQRFAALQAEKEAKDG